MPSLGSLSSSPLSSLSLSSDVHSYWRLVELTATANGTLSCAEVVMTNRIGGQTLTTNGVASASDFLVGFPPTNAFDANATTYWSSNNDSLNVWLQYQFPAPVSISEVRITPRGDTYANTQGWQSFQLQYSDDGINWKQASTTWTAAAWSIGVVQTFEVNAPVLSVALASGVSIATGYSVTKISSVGSISGRGSAIGHGPVGPYEVTWFGTEILRDTINTSVNAAVTWFGTEILRDTISVNAAVTWFGTEILRDTINTSVSAAVTWFGIEVLQSTHAPVITSGDDGSVTILWFLH